ncbi:MAG: methyltransferase [Kofleriaceae bacterium]|nr:methyltransferase [Kofleriaceae bacterium]
MGIELPLAADAKGTGAAGDADATLPARLAATLAAPPTRALLTALTDGPVRWRLALGGAGHRRAVVWRAAQAVRAAAPELINDPKATTWDVVVDAARTTVELRPHKLDDPRFAWRVADVPASSHPTVAAALARLAGARADDVVWDPFCGSGAELIERARLGPWRRLVGSDLDDRALAAARANLAAAGLADRAELIRADALAHDPGGVTLIITNPPLGRRIRGDAAALLEQFVTRAARLLAPDGRLVWITPAVRRTHDAAIRAGLYRDVHHIVDLGGYDGDLEVWRPTSGLARGRHRPAS